LNRLTSKLWAGFFYTHMGLYTSTQRFLRFGFRLFYHKVHIHSMGNVPLTGPVLLVSNHPNSFMDALLIGAYLPRSTHFLARGDAFNNPLLAKVFKAYNMLPVYRISEGKENIEKNFETFDVSYTAVNEGGMVLIFGEGLCKNNWDLRPLKKGPARIAQRAWNGTDAARELAIIPVGLTYEHFDGGGKSVMINYGKPITRETMENEVGSPNFVQQLNTQIATQLEQLAYVNRTLQSDTPEHHQMMHTWQKAESDKKNVLTELYSASVISGGDGKRASGKRWFTMVHLTLIALPHYWVSKAIAAKLTRGSVFYDSIFYGLVLFMLPIYLLVLAGLISYFI
jgi:1-acyl-sn-glycerol-3-phosphate acyltransferase